MFLILVVQSSELKVSENEVSLDVIETFLVKNSLNVLSFHVMQFFYQERKKTDRIFPELTK